MKRQTSFFFKPKIVMAFNKIFKNKKNADKRLKTRRFSEFGGV